MAYFFLISLEYIVYISDKAVNRNIITNWIDVVDKMSNT